MCIDHINSLSIFRIRSRLLGDLPLDPRGVFEIFALGLPDEKEAEDGRQDVETHKDEEGVGAHIGNHIWTGDGEAHGGGPVGEHRCGQTDGADASGEDFWGIGPW